MVFQAAFMDNHSNAAGRTGRIERFACVARRNQHIFNIGWNISEQCEFELSLLATRAVLVV